MSAAVLSIRVATRSDVPDGQSRMDGVPNQVVTLRSMGAGSTHEVVFFDVANPGVGSSTLSPYAPDVPSITVYPPGSSMPYPSGDGRTFYFMPPGGADGHGQSFGLELIVDRGLPTEIRSRRKYAIPTLTHGLIYPVFGEGADPEAAIYNAGATQVGNSCDNTGGSWRGFLPHLIDLMQKFEAL